MLMFPQMLAAAESATSAPTTAAAGVSVGLVLVIVAVALVFDFLNGFHDAANSIATVVSTRVLSPAQAVIWAAVFNFAAAFFFGTKVAHTIAGDLLHLHPKDTSEVYVVLAGLVGAITWNIITWLLRLP